MEREQIYEELKKYIISSQVAFRLHIEILEGTIRKTTFDEFYNTLKDRSYKELIDLIKYFKDDYKCSRLVIVYILEIIEQLYPEKMAELIKKATIKEKNKPYQKIINYIKNN